MLEMQQCEGLSMNVRAKAAREEALRGCREEEEQAGGRRIYGRERRLVGPDAPARLNVPKEEGARVDGDWVLEAHEGGGRGQS